MAVRFVLDNSVVMTWCFLPEKDEYAASVLRSLKTSAALVPAVWPLEAGNVLVVAERNKRLSEARIVLFLSKLSQLPIKVEAEGPERMFKEIFALAREHQLSTYDASYLDLALRLNLPLATRDAALARAAKKIGVPIYRPG